MRGLLLTVLSFALMSSAVASEDRALIGRFAIDRTEVTIGQFRAYARATNRTTAAEREGGGFDFAGGWMRRNGWTWRTPQGEPAKDAAPAVHISWNEAREFCAYTGGRFSGTVIPWATSPRV
jgi:sulfatase modifying factor 1